MKLKSIFLIAFVLQAGCLWAQSRDTRSLEDFSRVSVGESVNLILIQGNKNEAQIETDGIETDDVETRVSGGKLTIGIRNKVGSFWKNTDACSKKT